MVVLSRTMPHETIPHAIALRWIVVTPTVGDGVQMPGARRRFLRRREIVQVGVEISAQGGVK
jgi:hypothetical protein